MKRLVLIIGLMGAAAGARADGAAAAPKKVVATLQRKECFGECPVYTLTVYDDGALEYRGERFVAVAGLRTDKLTPRRMRKLAAAFAKADFFALDDKYVRYDVTDGPWATISCTKDGRTKTIEHYLGDRSAPPALSELENRFDDIAGSRRWVAK